MTHVAKPFSFCRAFGSGSRRNCASTGTSEDAVLNIGSNTFRPGHQAPASIPRGAKVRLTEKETAILKTSVSRARPAGRFRARCYCKDVWGYNSSVTTHTLETHILSAAAKRLKMMPAALPF